MTMESINRSGHYIYCVTRSESAARLAATGIDDHPVSCVAVNGLAAVVSPSEVKRYRLSRQYTLAHELVIEKAMTLGTVLPVRFGTVAENEELIRRKLLSQRAADLEQHLQRMDGKVEMGVKVMWNAERIYADIVERNATIRVLRDRLAGLPPEETHYERIQLGKMVEDALTMRKGEDADWIVEKLGPHALEVRRNDVYGETMVLNASLLIEAAREAELDAAVQSIDHEFAGLVTIKYVGPLPPFNFVNLVINWT
jgi:hypothetical protein